MRMKTLAGGVVAAVLFASSTFAADTAPTAPLPAGKPAGTKDAAFLGLGALAPIVIGGVFAAFIAVAASGGFNSKDASATTTAP